MPIINKPRISFDFFQNSSIYNPKNLMSKISNLFSNSNDVASDNQQVNSFGSKISFAFYGKTDNNQKSQSENNSQSQSNSKQKFSDKVKNGTKGNHAKIVEGGVAPQDFDDILKIGDKFDKSISKQQVSMSKKILQKLKITDEVLNSQDNLELDTQAISKIFNELEIKRINEIVKKAFLIAKENNISLEGGYER